MTIFKSLRTDTSLSAWGIALSRVLPRRSEQAFWPYTAVSAKVFRWE